MKNNQIGIIGLGYWGTNIVNVLLKLGVNEIYCFDKNYENLKEIKKKFPRVKTIKDLNVLLKIKPNGVIISVDSPKYYDKVTIRFDESLPKDTYRVKLLCKNIEYYE